MSQAAQNSLLVDPRLLLLVEAYSLDGMIFDCVIELVCTQPLLHRIMRRTGKLHTLAVISALLGVISSVYVALWNFGTSKFHLWLDLVPCGFGIASLFTALLIVNLHAYQMISSPYP